MATKLPRPPIDEERLMLMLARAGRVYRGESQPQVGMAEDILLLVGELRETRKLLSLAESRQSDKVFDQFESIFKHTAGSEWSGRPASRTATFTEKLTRLWRR